MGVSKLWWNISHLLSHYSCFKKKVETNNGLSAVGHKAFLKKNSAEGLGDTS